MIFPLLLTFLDNQSIYYLLFALSAKIILRNNQLSYTDLVYSRASSGVYAHNKDIVNSHIQIITRPREIATVKSRKTA